MDIAALIRLKALESRAYLTFSRLTVERGPLFRYNLENGGRLPAWPINVVVHTWLTQKDPMGLPRPLERQKFRQCRLRTAMILPTRSLETYNAFPPMKMAVCDGFVPRNDENDTMFVHGFVEYVDPLCVGEEVRHFGFIYARIPGKEALEPFGAPEFWSND